MRIALATTHVPFVRGGAELLAESLQRELTARGHDVNILQLPFNWYPVNKLRDSMLAGGLLDFDHIGGHPIDLVIGLKFPAYLAKHPNKVFWLIHQHRQAYEQWDQGIGDMQSQAGGKTVRNAIWDADRAALAGQRVFTISQNVSHRLDTYLSIPSRALYHPPPIAHLLSPGQSEDYILVPSRLNAEKRQELVLRALAECSKPSRAIFVGAPDDDQTFRDLQRLARELGISDRVSWKGAVEADKLAELYRRALAVIFVPRNEDYGYVTLEAMLAGKPVITVSDSGGPLEFIEDGCSGLVTNATSSALAGSIDRLWEDRSLARHLGEGALKRYHEMDIGWDAVVNHLVNQAPNFRPGALAERSPKADGVEEPQFQLPSAPPRDMKQSNFDYTPDVEELAQRAGVATIKQLFDAFEFGPNVNDELAGYLDSHWLRYLQTASLLPQRSTLRILDLGAVRPHVFLGLLKLLHPSASFQAVVEKDYEAVGVESYPSRRGTSALDIHTTAFNVETDTFPYPENTFDVVLAMEVVEHLALNPAHVFREVARVLRPDGQFIVTTPNVVSDMALKKVFHGNAPYSFGVFVPYHGVYGRHNREYTPHEIEQLGKMAGLSTSRLFTKDVYPQQVDDAHAFADNFPQLKTDTSLRGQNIFYAGRRSGAKPESGPSPLYLEDPSFFTGKIVAKAPLQGSEEIQLELSNTGDKDWNEHTVNLVLTAIAGEGKLGRFIRFPLPVFVPAGGSRTLVLPIAAKSYRASCIILAQLERRGHGWLSSVGVSDIRFVADADWFARTERTLG